MIDELEKNVVLEPDHDGAGSLVPRDPERDFDGEASERRRLDEIPEGLSKFINGLWERCQSQNSTEWLHAKQVMIKARKYFDGKQNGYVNSNLEWQEYEVRPNEVYYTDNIYTPHIQTALMEISRGRTELIFSHTAPDSKRGENIAKIAKARYATHRKRLFNSIITQQENLSLLLNGLAARYTFYSKDRKKSEKIPVIKEKEYEEEGPMVCSMCMSPMKGEVCGHCGNEEAVKMENKGRAKVLEGYDFVPSGRSNFVSVDPLGLQFFMAAVSVADTPYIIWNQVAFKDVLQSKYPNITITEGIESRELRYKHQADTHGPNQSEAMLASETSDDTVAEFQQGWFDYELYCHRYVPEDVQLRDGRILRAGTKLGDAFPDGMYVARNGDKILDLWNENKNEKWTIAPYVTRLGTMVGAGTAIALSNQDIKNDLRNYQMQSAFHDAFRRMFVNPSLIDPDNIPNDPTEMAVTNDIPDGQKIVGWGIDVLPGSQLTPEVYKIEEMVEQSVQNQLGTFSPGGAGAPDLKAVQDTATGLELYREMTVGRFAPMLEMRANALDKEQAYQLLLMDQKYLTPQQWERLKGDYGAMAVKEFLECDLREELLIEVAYESYMPQSNALRLRKSMEYINLAGVMMQMGISPESEYGAYVSNLLGQPQEMIVFDKEYDKAYAMIQMFKEISDAIVEQYGDIPSHDFRNDPVAAELAMVVIRNAEYQIDPEMDSHPALIDSYKDWWVKDEGRMASNLLKATVALVTQMHLDAMQAQVQQEMAEQQAMMQQQQEQQMAMDDQVRQQDREDAMMEGLANIAESDAQREHEQYMQERELEAQARENEPPVVTM